MYDKAQICEKFINRGLPLVRLDEKFLFYTEIVEELQATKTDHVLFAIKINLKPLLDGICAHAIEWKNVLGKILCDRTNQNVIEMKNRIKVSLIKLKRKSNLNSKTFFLRRH